MYIGQEVNTGRKKKTEKAVNWISRQVQNSLKVAGQMKYKYKYKYNYKQKYKYYTQNTNKDVNLYKMQIQ